LQLSERAICFGAFYVLADNQLHAERLLRGAFPEARDIQWHLMPENVNEPCTFGPMKSWNGK
jgi:hypothetical protein